MQSRLIPLNFLPETKNLYSSSYGQSPSCKHLDVEGVKPGSPP